MMTSPSVGKFQDNEEDHPSWAHVIALAGAFPASGDPQLNGKVRHLGAFCRLIGDCFEGHSLYNTHEK